VSLAAFLDAAVEPLRHGFMIKAMLVGVFVCVVCAVLSCFVVLKGWSLVGDALAHAVLPGIVIAFIVGLPMALGAILSGVGCVLAAGAARSYSRVKPDALLGISFTGFLAVGLILVVATPSDVHFLHVLFGNLLGIHTDDIIQAAVVGTLAVAAVAVLRKDLILFCFEPAQARVLGLSPARLELILLFLVAMTVVAALQAVGVCLVMAMLVMPGCVGFLLADRFGRMMAISCASAAVAAVVGTMTSFYIDGATGACIVLAQAALFILAFLFAPKKGLLVAARPREAAAAPR
jgi:ABC-type Mn2+/Zn2+ transport system permease subunit